MGVVSAAVWMHDAVVRLHMRMPDVVWRMRVCVAYEFRLPPLRLGRVGVLSKIFECERLECIPIGLEELVLELHLEVSTSKVRREEKKKKAGGGCG